MSQAALRDLLADALALWDAPGRVVAEGDGVAVLLGAARATVLPADPALRPVRWFVTTPERSGRAAASVAGVLGVLRDWARTLGPAQGESAARAPAQGEA